MISNAISTASPALGKLDFMLRRLLLSLALILSGTAALRAADSPREKVSLDSGWRFHLGDDPGFEENLINAGVNGGPAAMDFKDRAWRRVDLPHDWAVELPFEPKADASHGYKPVGPGFPTNSVGWYRRHFELPAQDQGKRLWLEFGAVYRKCQVFLNGYKLLHHEGGYNSFRCDITDLANCGGQNLLALRVDASEQEGWFYEGAGIYRHVWLVKTAPAAIAPDGIFVSSQFQDQVPRGPAQIHLETQLLNSQDAAADLKVRWQVRAPDGGLVAETTGSATLAAWASHTVIGQTKVDAPRLWSTETPHLYKLITTVESRGKVTDRMETEFGIRTIVLDADRGLLLNGQPCFAKGVCNHQDHAGVGVAVPDALQYFRLAKLREMGGNALRTAHNEPAEEILQACDRLGILVMDETRHFASDPQSLADLEQQVRRDRSHPSVFLWSLGNEEPLQYSAGDAAIARTMRRLVHQLDPTRPCTAALYDWPTSNLSGIFAGLDVQGFNYFDQGDTDAFHQNHPHEPCFGSEEGMAQYTRGIYENTDTYLAAYETQKPGLRHPAEASINYYAARPWLFGVFFWTGLDYRGEPAPFGWPNISSDFGILDTCGFPKDVFYYLQSCWSERTVLHLLPHWNWPGKEGKTIDVWAYSNCRAVELFLNGRSLGKKPMSRLAHLQWDVKYEPGTLSAKGYDGEGKVMAETKVETTGAPAAVQLTPDRAVLHADGKDCSVVTVALTDAQGRVVPVANNLVHFELSGPGKIIGVGNGDPICHEPDVYLDRADTYTIALGDWRMLKVSNLKDCPEVGESVDDSQWQKVDVARHTGPLRPEEAAVFRTTVQLRPEDLAVERADLSCGMIDDEGRVYVNGQLVGESHDWQKGPSFEVRKFLRAGANSIAVAVQNHSGSGGVNQGVALEFARPPIRADWQRSPFNGLAQVIIQVAETPGQVQLTARADGLQPATVVLRIRSD